MDIEIVDLTEKNFNLHSFDEFEFRQDVTSCWRYGKQGYNLTPVSYTDDENSQRKKQHAKRILESIKSDCVAFGAVHNGMLVGFAVLDKKIFGKSARYMNLSELYVSRPFRENGTGKCAYFLLQSVPTRIISPRRCRVPACRHNRTASATVAYLPRKSTRTFLKKNRSTYNLNLFYKFNGGWQDTYIRPQWSLRRISRRSPPSLPPF